MKGLFVALLLVGAGFCQETEHSTRHPDDNLIASSTAATKTDGLTLPAPVDVGIAVGVDEKHVGEVPRVEIDTDGIPIVHGVVMPGSWIVIYPFSLLSLLSLLLLIIDDPTDTKIWRNARVLNNVLVENSQQRQRADNSNNSSGIQEQSDMFVYRPESPRILSDGADFQPSQADPNNFSPSLPYPAFYYQRFYQDKGTQQQLPDSLAVETDAADSTNSSSDVVQEEEDGTDGRGFNVKKKKTGINKQTPGSSYGASAIATGRPIAYYVQPDEAKAIHDDRSPYEYEPAQSSYYTAGDYSTQGTVSKVDYDYYQQQQLQLQQQQQQQILTLQLKQQQEQQQLKLQQQQLLLQQQQEQQQAQSQQQQVTQENPQRIGASYYQQNSFLPGSVVPAPADSFVIRDQTYSSGGQTFSVPIPIPKDQYVQQYGQQQQYQYAQQPQYQYTYQQIPQQYYKQQQPLQPFEFLGTKLKEQVQKAKDMIHGMTDPVVDPLMEAGQKISTNLGLPERVNKINEKVATPSVLVPLAMVGGAALALGGLGTAIHLSNPNTKNNVFKALKIDNTTLAERITTALHPMNTKTVENITRDRRSLSDEDESYPGEQMDEEKENLLDQVLSALNGPQKSFLAQLQRTGFDEWQKTPCAKRIFCDVMVQQNDDAISLMEKRMSTFLSL